MKTLVVTICFLYLVAGQRAPPLWNIVGGQLGIGSLYNVVNEQITFPGFEFHYNQSNTVVINNQEYTIPDECYGFSSPSYLNDSRLLIVDSFSFYYKEYVSTWGITAGINIDGVSLDFAFSHTKGQIDQLLQDEVNFFAQNILSWNQFVIQMWPGKPTLSPQFKSYLDQLPHKYDPAIYKAFIEKFGTHVITKCSYGARVNFTAQFHSNLVDKMGISWVKNQVSLTVGWMEFKVGINWENFDNTTQIDRKFLENSKNVTQIVGGQPAILAAEGFKEWWKTVENEYAVLYPNSEITPLFAFVDDPVIAANLKKAIIAYGTGKLGFSGNFKPLPF